MPIAKAAVRHYFGKAIGQNGGPETITVDTSRANLATLTTLNADRRTPIKIRQNKYLNNVIEQDHRLISGPLLNCEWASRKPKASQQLVRLVVN